MNHLIKSIIVKRRISFYIPASKNDLFHLIILIIASYCNLKPGRKTILPTYLVGVTKLLNTIPSELF